MTKAEPISSADLTALMCARLCHDLISPIGAIGNGVGMLDDPEASDMHAEALDLVRTSAEQAWAKLEMLRIAFGLGGSAPGRIDVGELRGVVTRRYGGGRHRFVWNTRGESFEKMNARVLLNLILLTVDALPRGGDIVIDVDGDRVTVAGTGPRARLAPHVSANIAGSIGEHGLEPPTVQAYYAGLLVRQAGGEASAIADGETVTFSATVPAVQAAIHAAE